MTDLGDTLHAWRDRLTPAAVGLPAGRARRAKGLRREELAGLAGISADYVVRLEQGRFTTPSAQVVAALARALRLTGEERDHLYRLAGLSPPAAGALPDRIPAGVERLLSRVGDAAAAVFAADWRMIWWNPGWAALLGDPSATPPERRNFARDTFPLDGDGRGLSHWPVTSRAEEAKEAAIVSDLRRATGRFPGNPRLTTLIGTLTAGNARFAALWASGAVAAHREDHKVVHHPAAGPVEVDCDVLTDGADELKIVLLTAAPGSDDETRLRSMSARAGLSPQPGRPRGAYMMTATPTRQTAAPITSQRSGR
ncbi:helix-turn-helix transcriptional regulator [Actinoplanes sp. NPDC051411]|uniref:helix-turn-helix transcriptional regulator n=1 Tax=Actinoplanes sp. NPDC051411 TaxID=3155522 RepID=UPI0034320D8E